MQVKKFLKYQKFVNNLSDLLFEPFFQNCELAIVLFLHFSRREHMVVFSKNFAFFFPVIGRWMTILSTATLVLVSDKGITRPTRIRFPWGQIPNWIYILANARSAMLSYSGIVLRFSVKSWHNLKLRKTA